MKVYLENGFVAISPADGVIRWYSRHQGGIFSIQQDGNFITMFIISGLSGANEKILPATNFADVLDADGNAAGGNIETVIAYLQDLLIET